MKTLHLIFLGAFFSAQLLSNSAKSQGFVAMPGQKLIGENSLLSTTPLYVGIGYNNPTYSLHIDNSSSGLDNNLALTGLAPSINFANSTGLTRFTAPAKLGLATAAGDFISTSSASDFVLETYNNPTGSIVLATQAQGRIRIDNNGQVGINTESHPGTAVYDRFDVNLNPGEFARIENMPGTTANYDLVSIDPSGRLYRTPGGGTGTGLAWLLAGNTVSPTDFMGSNNSADVVFKSNGLERMRITAGGPIGIGCTAPNYALQIDNTTLGAYDNTLAVTGVAPSINFANNASVLPSTAPAKLGYASAAGDFVYTSFATDFVLETYNNTTGSIILATEAQTRERIDNNGYVGINTEFPNHPTSAVLDRFDVDLNQGEFIRFENMPLGNFPSVVINPATGRLYMSANASGTGPAAPETQQISDLQNQVTALKEELATLKSTMADLSGLAGNNPASTSSDGSLAQKTGDALYQNIPNPFNSETSIGYVISHMTANAAIMISDMNGKELSRYPIDQAGKGSITVRIGNMVPGMYLYTLIVDGNPVDTKKMVVNNGQ